MSDKKLTPPQKRIIEVYRELGQESHKYSRQEICDLAKADKMQFTRGMKKKAFCEALLAVSEEIDGSTIVEARTTMMEKSLSSPTWMRLRMECNQTIKKEALINQTFNAPGSHQTLQLTQIRKDYDEGKTVSIPKLNDMLFNQGKEGEKAKTLPCKERSPHPLDEEGLI